MKIKMNAECIHIKIKTIIQVFNNIDVINIVMRLCAEPNEDKNRISFIIK